MEHSREWADTPVTTRMWSLIHGGNIEELFSWIQVKKTPSPHRLILCLRPETGLSLTEQARCLVRSRTRRWCTCVPLTAAALCGACRPHPQHRLGNARLRGLWVWCRWAYEYEQTAAVELLLAAGVDPTEQDSDGNIAATLGA